MRTVQTQALRRGVAALQGRAPLAARALAAAGLAPDALRDAETRIPFRAFAAFYEHAAALTGDPCFGVRVGARAELATYDALGYAALSSATLGEALATVARYLGVLEDGAVTTLAVQGDEAVLAYRVVDPQTGAATQVLDLGLAVLCRWAGTLAGPGWQLREVHLTRAEPADSRAHAALFRAPLRFGAAEDAVVFAAADLSRPVRTADPHLRRLMERDLARNLSRLPDPEDEVEAVRRAIAGRLHRGAPTLAAVADELGVSRRTLQRRLRGRGLAFRELRDQVRQALACEYLREPARSVAEVALLLGYGELSAFHHAFRRWTGRTPGSFRRAAAGAKSQSPGAG